MRWRSCASFRACSSSSSCSARSLCWNLPQKYLSQGRCLAMMTPNKQMAVLTMSGTHRVARQAHALSVRSNMIDEVCMLNKITRLASVYLDDRVWKRLFVVFFVLESNTRLEGEVCC